MSSVFNNLIYAGASGDVRESGKNELVKLMDPLGDALHFLVTYRWLSSCDISSVCETLRL